MNKITKIKLFILITVGITFTLFSVIHYDLNFIVGNKNKINSNDISFNKNCLKTSQYSVLYFENFDDGIADYWVNIGGTWTVENNTYKATGVAGERVRSYYINQSFSYYIYEGDFNLVSGNEMQIIFNIQDIYAGVDQGHYCQITLFYDDPYGRKDTAVIYSTQNGQIEHKNTAYDFTHNQWYHFSVISTGDNIDFFLNNSLVLSYSGLFYTSGYIGVKSMFGPTGYWDNIKVSAINNSRKIHIDGNSDWVALRNAGNCTGQGIYSDPYVIKDLIINGEGSGHCILIENSNVYFKIENCTLHNSGINYGSGIRLYNVSNGQLINNTANNHVSGLILESSYNNNISGNTVNYNSAYGMEISYSDNNVISNNTANNNGNYGISLAYCDNNTILENTLNSNSENGIDLWISNYNNISGNTANYNNEVGIWLSGNDNNIVENYVENNDITGIYLESSHDNTVSRNTANDNDYGIRLMDSYYNNISGNTVNYNYYGIQLRYSDSNIFLTNNLNNNDYGFHLYYSYENNLSGNIINDNSYSGIWLFYSDDNTITDNTLWENNEGIRLSSSDENNILANNINDNSYRGIHLSNSDNNVISFNIITNNDIGIYLYYSYSNEISNNNFSGNNEDIVEYIYTEPPPSPETIIIVIVVVIIIISICTAMGVYRKRVSRPRTKIFPFEKYRLPEKPIKEITLKHETISELKTPTEVEKLEVAQDELEKPLNIYQLRSKFKNEIEKIREIVHRENFIISLSGIDEIIKSLENLNLKDRREIMDVYLNKLIEYSIRLREEVYKRLINENDVKKANLEINRTEVDLMRRILSIERIEVSKPEKQLEKVETLQEEVQEIGVPTEQVEEIEVIQEEVILTPEEKPVEQVLIEEVPSALQEIPKEVEVLPEEEIIVGKPEVQPKEIIPPEPKIINCPFCGLAKDEAVSFCSQCGMVFKKK